MRTLLVTSFVVAHFLAATPTKSETNPYWAIVTWYAAAVCTGRYGLTTAEQSYSIVSRLAKKEYGMEDWQIHNITKSEGFDKDVKQVIKEQGGCRKLSDHIKN